MSASDDSFRRSLGDAFSTFSRRSLDHAHIPCPIPSLHKPTLLFHGEKDMLMPVKSSKEVLNKISSKDKDLKVIEGTGHATLLEPSKYEVLRNIHSWLDERC